MPPRPRRASRIERAAEEGAIATADRALDADLDGNRLTLSSGVVLSFHDAPPYAARRVALSIPEPEVPRVWIESKGREELNDSDPEYLRQVDERNDAILLGVHKLALVMATTIEAVPDGMPGPDDGAWLEELEAVGVEVDISTPSRRKLAWLELYAMRNSSDIAASSAYCMRHVGLTEAEVAAAAASFRSRATRREHPPASDAQPGPDGHHVPPGESGPGS